MITASLKQEPRLPFVSRQTPRTTARKHGREAYGQRDERMQRWHYRLEKLFARQMY